jgi:hypothetical protein
LSEAKTKEPKLFSDRAAQHSTPGAR